MFTNIRVDYVTGGAYVTGKHPSFGDTTIYVFKSAAGQRVWSAMKGSGSQALYHQMIRNKMLSKMLDVRMQG